MGDKGELFAEEVRAARANNFPIIMVHENDEAAGGCEFARFFESTPQDLIADGLYKALAYAWYPDPFRAVSVALVAQAFGAEEPESKNPMDQVRRLGRKALRAVLPAATLAALAKMLDTRRDRHRKKHHLSADAADVIVSKAVAEAEASSRARAEASARPSQAEAEEPSQKPQTVGTLHKRSPTTGMYKKFKVAIEGDTLCYADFKEPWRQKPPAVLHGAHVDRLEVARRAAPTPTPDPSPNPNPKPKPKPKPKRKPKP